eukprot:scaffold3827_cov179-Cylindrotheca_fusiformis.AAC.28
MRNLVFSRRTSVRNLYISLVRVDVRRNYMSCLIHPTCASSTKGLALFLFKFKLPSIPHHPNFIQFFNSFYGKTTTLSSPMKIVVFSTVAHPVGQLLVFLVVDGHRTGTMLITIGYQFTTPLVPLSLPVCLPPRWVNFVQRCNLVCVQPAHIVSSFKPFIFGSLSAYPLIQRSRKFFLRFPCPLKFLELLPPLCFCILGPCPIVLGAQRSIPTKPNLIQDVNLFCSQRTGTFIGTIPPIHNPLLVYPVPKAGVFRISLWDKRVSVFFLIFYQFFNSFQPCPRSSPLLRDRAGIQVSAMMPNTEYGTVVCKSIAFSTCTARVFAQRMKTGAPPDHKKANGKAKAPNSI